MHYQSNLSKNCKENLIEMWCKLPGSSKNKFEFSRRENEEDLDLATCDSCGKEQFIKINSTFNFYCNYCPHYCGPAQCNTFCCIYLQE